MKHSSKEAFYQRMRDLADVKGSLNEEKRTVGDLIDYKKGADNVNYGIVKENHHYFLKKSNKKIDESKGEKLGPQDFAYIGGLENITKYRYDKLSEADKQRNMVLNTINEALGSTSPVISEEKSEKRVLGEGERGPKKGADYDEEQGDVPGEQDTGPDEYEDGDKKEDKKDKRGKKDKKDKKEDKKDKKWNFEKKKDDVDESIEEDAEEELAAAEEKMKDAEMAAEKPEEEPEIPAEPDMGGGEESDVDVDSLEVPEEPEAEGGEETPEEPETDVDVSVDADGEETPEEPAPEGGEEDDALDVDEFGEVESLVAKAGEKMMGMELNDNQIEDLAKTFLGYLKDGLGNIDIGERKKIAKKYLIDVEEETEDAEEKLTQDIGAEEEMEEGKSCKECAFAKFAESKGYDVESLMECGTEEAANLVSSYAMENEELSEEDFESMAVLTDDAVMETLVNEYGHEELAENMKPYTENLNEEEASPEAKRKKIEGMFWWKTKPQEKKDTELKTLSEEQLAEYAEMDDEALAELDEETLNELNLAGLKNVGSFLGKKAGGAAQSAAQGVTQGVKGAAGAVKGAITQKIDQATQKLDQLGNEIAQQYQKGVKSTVETKLNKAAEEFGELVAKLDQASQKAGEGPINKQQLVMTLQGVLKGGNVKETVMGNDPAAVEVQPPLKEEEGEEEEIQFGADADDMGGAVVKPEGAETTTMDVEVDGEGKQVNISMNESEKKLRKYIRARLQEKAGLRKPVLNENKKSKKIKMLDKMIDEQ